VEVEQVEGVEYHAAGFAPGEVGLKRGEIRGAGRPFDHQFAVDDRLLRWKAGQRLGERITELVGPVEAAAGVEPDLAVVQMRLQAVAVELDLVQPALAGGGGGAERGERGGDEAGVVGF